MIIEEVSPITSSDTRRFAWARLKRFQNVAYVAGLIKELQEIPKKQERNVRKQAEQIRHCLIQAEEYHVAACSVSIATSPLLHYYSAMSLALAEVLFKGSGDVSLDRARIDHGHHGLVLKGANDVVPQGNLEDASAMLRALPHQHLGQRIGTFELWHRAAREAPIGGEEAVSYANGTRESGFKILATPNDQRMEKYPDSGISLLHCYKNIPHLVPFLRECAIQSDLVRATISQDVSPNQDRVFKLVVHPQHQPTIDRMSTHIRVPANSWEQINITQMTRGFIFTSTVGVNQPGGGASFPNSIQMNRNELWLCADSEFLNEFGLFFVALYIVGNYVRYFPEKWMREVENASPFAQSVNELIVASEERVPLLTLNQLSRTMYVAA